MFPTPPPPPHHHHHQQQQQINTAKNQQCITKAQLRITIFSEKKRTSSTC